MIVMTQDQYGQTRGSGYVVPGDVVPENEVVAETETEEGRTDEPKPMTRFQKVASALRGGSERDEEDEAAADRASAGRTAADVPAARTPAGETPVGEAPVGEAPVGEAPVRDVPAGDIGAPADDVPATAAEATGNGGRHAAATPATAATAADRNLRPGEAAG